MFGNYSNVHHVIWKHGHYEEHEERRAAAAA